MAMTATTTSLSYPIGKYDVRAPVDPSARGPAIEDIAALPARMRDAVAGLDEAQLDTPYRPGGWTVRTLVHHVADSHMNAYVRLKLALTEDAPTIKPYRQDAWAGLPDSRLPVEPSLAILDGVHARWTALGRALQPDEFLRTLTHPELGMMTVDALLQLYAWHSRHHVAHIVALRQRHGWVTENLR
jgi:hypothetical protein